MLVGSKFFSLSGLKCAHALDRAASVQRTAVSSSSEVAHALDHAASVQKTVASALAEVDIEEGTRRRRLVIRVGTRNTITHEATVELLQCPSVHSQWLCKC